MKKILIISLNSGGTMGHGKIISSLANYLCEKNKEVTIFSDMPFKRNFNLKKAIIKKNMEMVPHENYTIGGMCHCNQKDKIYSYILENKIDCVIFSTFFDLSLVKRVKEAKVKTILLSYPIRDTYRLALKQNKAYSTFDKVISLYGPCFTDKKMENELIVNPLPLVSNKVSKCKRCDILITCGGGGRPSSKIFLKKAVIALQKVINTLPNKKLKIKLIKGNSSIKIKNKNIETIIWTKDFGSLLSSSNIIISEAGFFTMLDLINYEKNAILVPGERIIDNQELRALRLEEWEIGKVFFPFENPFKLADLILGVLKNPNKNKEQFKKLKKKFYNYPTLGEVMLNELK